MCRDGSSQRRSADEAVSIANHGEEKAGRGKLFRLGEEEIAARVVINRVLNCGERQPGSVYRKVLINSTSVKLPHGEEDNKAHLGVNFHCGAPHKSVVSNGGNAASRRRRRTIYD